MVQKHIRSEQISERRSNEIDAFKVEIANLNEQIENN
jgi:hypothetical protein